MIKDDVTLYAFQAEAVEKMTARQQFLLAITMGGGKGLRAEDYVMTPDGPVVVNTVSVGDRLVGSNGAATAVIGVFPQGKQQCYEVTFSDRTSIVVDGAHRWYVETADERHRGRPGKVFDTAHMHAWGALNRQGNSRWFIPMVKPVEFSEQPSALPMDPYVLGVLLGDGALSNRSVSYCCGDELVPREVERRIPVEWEQKRRDGKGRTDSWALNGAVPTLRQLGLMGTHSWDKSVPIQYLTASVGDRLLLLQGLNDTDGSSHRNSSEFSTTSPQLAKDVVFLAQSLGGTATCSGRVTSYTYKGEKKVGRKSWRVLILLPPAMSPFLVRNDAGTPTKYQPRRAIRSVRKVGRFNTVCFAVDAEDSLFVVQDFIVTHNTVTAIATAEELIDNEEIPRGALIIVPGNLKYQWQQEIHRFTDRFALVIDGSPARRTLLYQYTDMYWYTIVNYEAVVNDWQTVRRLPFDCIVLDECFPAGTLVDTPTGRVPIETVNVGAVVAGAAGHSVVSGVGHRQVISLVKVVFEDGSSIISTANHAFFTQEGWQPASVLAHGTECVATAEAVRMVRGRVPDHETGRSPDRQVLREILLSEMEDEPPRVRAYAGHGEPSYSLFRGDEEVSRQQDAGRAKSAFFQGTCDVDRGYRTPTTGDVEGEWECNCEQGWQRFGAYGARGFAAAQAGQQVEVESCSVTRLSASTRLPDELQGRSCFGSSEAGSGSRRPFPPFPLSARTGSQEGRGAVVSRVDRVEVLESGHPDFDRLCRGGSKVSVFNLEVAGHPSYSVNGLLVHNCSYIKSPTAKRSKRVQTLGHLVDYRYALTGQPIENKPEDLFNIMRFVDDSVLRDFVTFDRTFIVRDGYGKAVGHKNLKLLRKRMSDAMIRKTRADLKGQLPDVVENVIPIQISSAEARLYNLIKNRLLEKMYEVMGTFGNGFDLEAHYGFSDNQSGAMTKAQGDIATMMLALRQVCDDARLLRLSAEHYKARRMVTVNDKLVPDPKGKGSQFAATLLDDGHLEVLPKSTKQAELRDLIKELITQDTESKIVVFSFFKEELRTLQEMTSPITNSVLYTGDMNPRQKEAAKQQFKRDPKTRLFLSSDAGGYGVDLPMANYLISFDLPWSTGKFEQRESRIIRLSTEFSYVTLIAMVVRGSIEWRMYESLNEKKGVAGAYLDGGYDSKGRYKMTLSSLTQFLEVHTV